MSTYGAACSKSGKAYEALVARLCGRFKSPFMDVPFNTQSIDDLGGCTIIPDVMLNCKSIGDVKVEVKAKNVPDWIQCSIMPSEQHTHWKAKPRSYQPASVIDMFEKELTAIRLFDGCIPSFLTSKQPTHTQWKLESKLFSDVYHPIPSDQIAVAYRLRGVHYIQVKGHGLFHTGIDICNFGVPFLECSQRIRIRCKRHGKKCMLTGKNIPSSVMASFRPVLSTLHKSPYSLDDKSRMPDTLKEFKNTNQF